MSVDFFAFETFNIPSEHAGCSAICGKVEQVDAVASDQEAATITLHTTILEPRHLSGEPFIFMIKLVAEAAKQPHVSDNALGYVSLIAKERPEDEREQLSGSCVEVTEALYKKWIGQIKRSGNVLRLKIETRFPAKKPTCWCAMGFLTCAKLTRKGQTVAAVSLDDLTTGQARFDE